MPLTAEQRIAGAKKSAEMRKLYAEQRKALRSLIEAPTLEQSQYSEKRLTRIRKQLDRIDDMMLSETDPQKLDRLASAQARLAEQERILSGRPLPGSLKPSSRQPRRAPGPSSPDLPQT